MTLSKRFKGSGLLSTGDVARELGVDRTTVWLWVKSEMLKSQKVGGFIGVKPADLAKFRKVYHSNSGGKT